MNKRESRSSILFRHWVMSRKDLTTCAFEIKDTRGKLCFPLREFKEDQENFANAIEYSEKGVLIRTDGVTGLPDYIFIKKEPSYVVIKFIQGLIIIRAFKLSNFKLKNKSISWEEAINIAEKVIPI